MKNTQPITKDIPQEKETTPLSSSTKSKVKVCEICQQSRFLTEETIKKALDNHKNCIARYAYILHDKDTDETGSLVAPHYHIIIQFKKDDGRELKHIAAWFNVPTQYVNKSTSTSKNKYLDMAKYLIHMNKDKKYQYDVSSVCANFDYEQFIYQTDKKKRKQDIINLIMDGKITPNNFTSLISPNEYDIYKKSILNAFEYKKKMDSSIERDMEVVYIYGESGSGKTSFAKHISQKRNLSIFIAGSGKDFMDGYNQESCIVLDDFRGEHLNFSDILKLLDNHTNSSVVSRYSNKDISNCKLLIITSVFSIEQFYNLICPTGLEPLLQLKRRCGTYIHIDGDTLHTYRYDSSKEDYVFVSDCINPLNELLQTKKNTTCYTDDELLSSLGLKRKPIIPKSHSSSVSNGNKNFICPF